MVSMEVAGSKGVAMADGTAKAQSAPRGLEDNPLGHVVSEIDREAMAMVRAALDARRLRLAFQPVVVANDTSRIAFHEALIRVLDPAGRIIPARDFMAAIETQELGRLLDCAALEMGLATLIRFPDLRLAINMSARSIGYGRWMRTLRRGLAVSPTVGERLILEITEHSAMLVPELVTRFMQDLQRDGIAFALDDFGAGFTVLRHFKDFLFDIVKIDSQFVRGIDADPDNQMVAQALVTIARQFDMFTVAEAVETVEEAEFLRSIGVDCLQGYLFGAPTVRPNFAARTP